MKARNNTFNYALNVICRWLVGLVFLFSSLSKGVDPLGTTYKVQEYMTAWAIGPITFDWALPLAQPLSVALIAAEFLVAILLLCNAYRRLSAWTLVLMMLFFTTTTLIDALTNKVSDCGCFGDALKLTNWQTFWKNVALGIPTVWIFFTRNLHRRRRFERDGTVFLGALAAILVFEFYNIAHEPLIDFRPWKKGNTMVVEREAMNHLTLRNLESGQQTTVDYPNGGWDQVPDQYKDFDRWEIVSSTSDEPFEVKADGFAMMDLEGNDHSADLLTLPEGIVIITAHHLTDIDDNGARQMRAAMRLADDNAMQVVLLTSALPEEAQAWTYEHQMEQLDCYFADATAIKAIMRGNPGFLLMKEGRVIDKGRKATSLKTD